MQLAIVFFVCLLIMRNEEEEKEEEEEEEEKQIEDDSSIDSTQFIIINNLALSRKNSLEDILPEIVSSSEFNSESMRDDEIRSTNSSVTTSGQGDTDSVSSLSSNESTPRNSPVPFTKAEDFQANAFKKGRQFDFEPAHGSLGHVLYCFYRMGLKPSSNLLPVFNAMNEKSKVKTEMRTEFNLQYDFKTVASKMHDSITLISVNGVGMHRRTNNDPGLELLQNAPELKTSSIPADSKVLVLIVPSLIEGLFISQNMEPLKVHDRQFKLRAFLREWTEHIGKNIKGIRLNSSAYVIKKDGRSGYKLDSKKKEELFRIKELKKDLCAHVFVFVEDDATQEELEGETEDVLEDENVGESEEEKPGLVPEPLVPGPEPSGLLPGPLPVTAPPPPTPPPPPSVPSPEPEPEPDEGTNANEPAPTVVPVASHDSLVTKAVCKLTGASEAAVTASLQSSFDFELFNTDFKDELFLSACRAFNSLPDVTSSFLKIGVEKNSEVISPACCNQEVEYLQLELPEGDVKKINSLTNLFITSDLVEKYSCFNSSFLVLSLNEKTCKDVNVEESLTLGDIEYDLKGFFIKDHFYSLGEDKKWRFDDNSDAVEISGLRTSLLIYQKATK